MATKNFSDVGLVWKRPFTLGYCGGGPNLYICYRPRSLTRRRYIAWVKAGRIEAGMKESSPTLNVNKVTKKRKIPKHRCYFSLPPSVERGYPTHGHVGVPSRKRENYKAFKRSRSKEEINEQIEEYYSHETI